ncbi:RNA dependent RNA polymerase [Plasmopara viticola lesion associated ourmia-like virus 7]|uniref:RNA dependent RNA polymerase n=1 Tax=Plasmopara viticola lesion associated ourmia-like virus 7 TaxID=2686542 RepID=A0ABX6FIZ0_9VIRU|nr:RNA dependent RNA polymerase [Plasmopara viticola lesion associated ourmia-like virus 7]QGY72537.1 RNA dependent RNA polymerase [Plasmopara viticola lesion associated ourmia-like virus 7]
MTSIKKSLGAVGCPVMGRLKEFVGAIGEPYGLSLPLPDLQAVPFQDRLSLLKKFCGGFLEKPVCHLWHRPTMHLSRKSRMSIAMSLFLFRKVLPSEEHDVVEYAKKMSEESPDPSPHFLHFIREELPKLFRYGWDRGAYENSSLNSVLPISSCRGSARASGGCRMLGLSKGSDSWNDRESFVEHVLTATSCRKLKPSQLLQVETGGKYRIVSKSDLGMNSLRPLHSAIYNHLSRFSWLLRGDAKASRFSDFVRKPGEVFVSGDYESATDNLNGHVQREILRMILEQTDHVPQGIKDRALESMTSELDFDGVTYQQRRGQLMGNLLSFPLLCIVNYLAFRWVAGPSCPVKINGDDIVFRSSPGIADRWMESVSLAGLTLSRGKTMVDKSYFTLNSRMFISGFSKVHSVPCVRATAFFGLKEGPESLKGRSQSFCEGFSGHRRSLLRSRWLKVNRGAIEYSRRSVTRGLGINFSYGDLIRAGLWDREAWYLSFESEKALPPRLSVLCQNGIPEGWAFRSVEKLNKKVRSWGKKVAPLLVERAWSEASLNDREQDWSSLVVQDTPSWDFFRQQRRRDLKRRSRLLGISARNTVRFLKPRLTTELQRRMGLWSLQRHSVLAPVSEDSDMLFSSEDNLFHIYGQCQHPRHPPPVEEGDVFEKTELRLGIVELKLGDEYHLGRMSNGQTVKVIAGGKGVQFGPPIF